MSGSEQVLQGVELMLIGMGTVFVFLTLLVFTTGLMSRLVALLPEPEAPATPAAGSAAPSGATSQQSGGNDLMAVISAAIHRHRSKTGNKDK